MAPYVAEAAPVSLTSTNAYTTTVQAAPAPWAGSGVISRNRRTLGNRAVANKRIPVATAIAYAVTYGVAFLFLAGPANMMLARTEGLTAVVQAQFGLVLTAVLVMGLGGASLSLGLTRVLERQGHSRRRVNVLWSGWAMVFGLLVAAAYVGVIFMFVAPVGGNTLAAAALGVFVPAVVAGASARHSARSIAGSAKDLAVGALMAVGVTAVVAYLCLSFLIESVGNVPAVAGL